MEIGLLNQRIAILENTVKVDGIGNHKTVSEEIYSCWASVSVKNSVENSDNGTTKEFVSLEFIVRQTLESLRISTSLNKLRFKGLVYDINGIIPNFKSVDYMKIVAGTRRVGDGYDFD